MESLLCSQLRLQDPLASATRFPLGPSRPQTPPAGSPAATVPLPWLSLTVLAPALWATQFAPAQAALQIGDTCEAVGDVQMALTELGYRPGPIDGIFGPATEEALLRFQESEALAIDGVAGLETAAALGLATGAASPYAPGQGCVMGQMPSGIGGSDPGAEADVAVVDRFRFYTVTASELNVRSGPGLDYDIVATLGEGDRLEGQAGASGWVRLRTGDWVSGDFLTEVEAAAVEGTEFEAGTTDSPSRIRVTVDVLNVRSQPSLDAEVVGTLLANEEYDTTGRVENGWVQLAWGDWVAGTYVLPVDGSTMQVSAVEVLEAKADSSEAEPLMAQVSTLGNPLLVRSAPGGDVVDVLADGSTVELSGRTEQGWSQLSNGNWVAGDYLAM